MIDAKRFKELDGDLCQLCNAYGADKRSLILACFYDVTEVVPEAIDLTDVAGALKGRGYYLRLCKSCRGRLLGMLKGWRNECIALRGLPKDHDGGIEDEDSEADYGNHADLDDAKTAIRALSAACDTIGALLAEHDTQRRQIEGQAGTIRALQAENNRTVAKNATLKRALLKACADRNWMERTYVLPGEQVERSPADYIKQAESGAGR
jgi:hypothetical protein